MHIELLSEGTNRRRSLSCTGVTLLRLTSFFLDIIRGHAVRSFDSADFASHVNLTLVEHDEAILRQFQGVV